MRHAISTAVAALAVFSRLVLVGLPALLPGTAGAAPRYGPQGVVREFCRADAAAQRVIAEQWDTWVAPLVDWPFEPAWDYVVLAAGYEVGEPRGVGPDELAVDVRYQVTGRVSADGFEAEPHLETVTYRIRPAGDGEWRITAPPPPPHVFETRAEVAAVRRSLDPRNDAFLANSTFVWKMFRSAGWNIDFERTLDMPGGKTFRPVEDPKPGDVVLFARDGVPYHVGILAGKHGLASATLNAGIVSTPVKWFAGEVTYLRLVEPSSDFEEDDVPISARPSQARVPATKTGVPSQPTPRPPRSTPPTRTATGRPAAKPPVAGRTPSPQPPARPSPATPRRRTPTPREQARKAAGVGGLPAR